MTGIDFDVLTADGPDMGDIIVDSIYNNHIDEDGEIGESLPRKLYNYFFSSKNDPSKFIYYTQKSDMMKATIWLFYSCTKH